MTHPLSPAAQAVLDAAYALPLRNGQTSIAAALQALADQVVPHADTPDRVLPKTEPNFIDDALMLVHNRTMHIRSEILAIVAELEGQR